MKDHNEVQTYITTLLLREYSLTRKITPQSRIYHDLRLRGQDAWEFLSAVFGKIQSRYFGVYF